MIVGTLLAAVQPLTWQRPFAFQQSVHVQQRGIAPVAAESRSAIFMRANLPPIGSKLPLPVALGNLDGVPGPVASLSELGGGSELLVISMSTESTMSDPLRQTLVGLQEKVVPLGAAAASVSLVPSGNNRKLARKAKVEFPLLSDPGREWLGPLGTLPSGEVALAVVSMPSVTSLYFPLAALFLKGSKTSATHRADVGRRSGR